MNEITLRTGAWCGDRTISLVLPKEWEIVRAGGNPLDPLSDEEIRKKIQSPVQASSLKILAQKRKSAVIIIDDIMRPTPTARILPFIIDELKEGGLSNDQIKIIIASGSHASCRGEDIDKKVGKSVADAHVVIPHTDNEDLVFLGNSQSGTPVFINKTVAEADLKITIGGIYPHPSAGYSGGVKTLVPGVCGLETIARLHAAFTPGAPGESLDNPFRAELTEIAEMIGLDFIVNTVLTPSRDIGAIFAGDKIEAHKKGVECAKVHYGVHLVKDADIVISNAYPFDGSYYFFTRGFWPLTTGKRGSVGILIGDGSILQEKYPFKSLYQSRRDRIHRLGESLMTLFISLKDVREFFARLRNLIFMKRSSFYLFATGDVVRGDLERQFPHAHIFQDWEALLKALDIPKSQHIKVAFYPYAPLQIPLDGVSF